MLEYVLLQLLIIDSIQKYKLFWVMLVKFI